MGVVMLGEPWGGALEPIANAVGALIGLLHMSGEMFPKKIVFEKTETSGQNQKDSLEKK